MPRSPDRPSEQMLQNPAANDADHQGPMPVYTCTDAPSPLLPLNLQGTGVQTASPTLCPGSPPGAGPSQRPRYRQAGSRRRTRGPSAQTARLTSPLQRPPLREVGICVPRASVDTVPTEMSVSCHRNKSHTFHGYFSPHLWVEGRRQRATASGKSLALIRQQMCPGSVTPG